MRRDRHRREDGFTLIECILTCALISVVLAAAFPVVPLFFSEANTVQNTYGSLDQLVLASETVTRYIHEAVDPSWTTTTYPFSAASANAVTFTADTGLSTGPEEVVVTVSTSSSGRSFTADIRSPLTNPDQCPFSTGTNTNCTYSTTATRSILLINNLTNGTGGSPVFTYTLNTGGTCGGSPPSSGGTELSSTLANNTSYSSIKAVVTSPIAQYDTLVIGSGANAQTVVANAAYSTSGTAQTIQLQSSFTTDQQWNSGTTLFDNTCSTTQLGEIEAVAINLQTTKNPGGQATGYQSLAYLLSPSYSTSVG